MTTWLLVCLGGALGTGLRYAVVRATVGAVWPLGTWLVNVIGSFVLGALSEWALTSGALAPAWRLALTVGVLGGFTTYSSFNQEVLQALVAGTWLRGIAYLVLTTTTCLVAGALGIVLVRRFIPA